MIQDSNESHSAGKRESSKVRELNTDEGNLYVEIGLRLRRIRREKDYTQEQMAEMLGISTAYYGKIERGVNSLSIKRLHTLNVKLGIDITYLITGKDNNTLSMGQILAECPIRKRHDLEQIIKHALNLMENTWLNLLKGMMKMIEIAICDDEKVITSDIEERIRAISKKLCVSINIDVFFDGLTLTDYIINQKAKYDIIYIDIEMKSENGVDAARKIRLFDKDVLLIYVTNHESFAKEVFEVSAFRFITKPISNEIFEKYFISAIDKIRQTPHFFQFQYNKVHYRLPLNQIIYFQSDKRVTYINIGTEIRKCYEKLNSIEQNLKQKGIYFFRTHQSFLVNPKYVEVYMYDTMQLHDGTVLSISENRRKTVNELYCKIKGDSIIV